VTRDTACVMAERDGRDGTRDRIMSIRAFINGPTGPKTTHFWGPVANWGFVLAVRATRETTRPRRRETRETREMMMMMMTMREDDA